MYDVTNEVSETSNIFQKWKICYLIDLIIAHIFFTGGEVMETPWPCTWIGDTVFFMNAYNQNYTFTQFHF